MLSVDERADGWALVQRAEAAVPRGKATAFRETRILTCARALRCALIAYWTEAERGPEARLDCLTTMVRAGVGALRERLDGDG